MLNLTLVTHLLATLFPNTGLNQHLLKLSNFLQNKKADVQAQTIKKL